MPRRLCRVVDTKTGNVWEAFLRDATYATYLSREKMLTAYANAIGVSPKTIIQWDSGHRYVLSAPGVFDREYGGDFMKRYVRAYHQWKYVNQ